jgi:hypothetical protein
MSKNKGGVVDELGKGVGKAGKKVVDGAKDAIKASYLSAKSGLEELKSLPRSWAVWTMAVAILALILTGGAICAAWSNGHFREKGLDLWTMPGTIGLLLMIAIMWNYGRPEGKDFWSTSIIVHIIVGAILVGGAVLNILYLTQCLRIEGTYCVPIKALTANATSTVADMGWGDSSVLCLSRSYEQFKWTSFLVLGVMCLQFITVGFLVINHGLYGALYGEAAALTTGFLSRLKGLASGVAETQAEADAIRDIDAAGHYGDMEFVKKCIRAKDYKPFLDHVEANHWFGKRHRTNMQSRMDFGNDDKVLV